MMQQFCGHKKVGEKAEWQKRGSKLTLPITRPLFWKGCAFTGKAATGIPTRRGRNFGGKRTNLSEVS
jgi:hypothetical protein